MVQKAGLRILRSFLNENERNFVELCNEAGYPTDLGGYYLRQLIASGYIEKGDRGKYILLPKGRRYIAKEHVSSDSAPRMHVLVIASFEDTFVVLQRNQQPFLDRKEWPATVLEGGEQTYDAISRLQNERLAQAKKVQYKGIFRRIDRYQDDLFDDKVFLVYRVSLGDSPRHEVVNGVNIQVPENDIASLDNKSRSLEDIFMFSKNEDVYMEKIYELSYSDFDPNDN